MKKHIDEVNISSSQTSSDPQGALREQTLRAAFEGKAAQGHDVRLLGLYDGQQLCATVYADFTAQEVAVESAGGAAGTAFGLEDQPPWAGFRAFAERRCLPCVEPDLQGYLTALGMDDKSPLIVLQKEAEQVNKNQQWIKLEVLKAPALTGAGQTG